MTDEPIMPRAIPPGDEPAADAANDLPGMPVPPPLDTPPAPTAEEPTRRSRTWMWLVAGVLVGVIAIVAVASFAGGDSDHTFSGHGVSFSYPADWQSLGPATFQVNAGDATWTESFGTAAGSSGAIVTEYALAKDVTDVSDADLQAELDNLFTSTVSQAGGELIEPLAPTTINGLSGYRVSFTSKTGGVDLRTEMVLLFRGMQQWNLQCQYTENDRDDVVPGCQQVWDTFSVDG